jgi:hypothetical protein
VTDPPVLDDSDFRFIWETAFVSAAMSNDNDFRRADEGLVSGECSMAILHALNDAIDTLKMFPYESANA